MVTSPSFAQQKLFLQRYCDDHLFSYVVSLIKSHLPRVNQVMAAIIKPAKRIRDLTELYKLMVTDYLPLDDKIKLVDTFPPVIDQIDVFDMNLDIPLDIIQVQLFNKLHNVKTITLKSKEAIMPIRTNMFRIRPVIRSYSQCPLFDDPQLVPNPGVNCFVDWNGDLAHEYLVSYVERILKSHPDYDGSCIKNHFEIADERVIDMVRRNPGLKIKLVMNCEKARDMSHLLHDERFRNMIVAFRRLGADFIESLPGGMMFESVDTRGNR